MKKVTLIILGIIWLLSIVGCSANINTLDKPDENRSTNITASVPTSSNLIVNDNSSSSIISNSINQPTSSKEATDSKESNSSSKPNANSQNNLSASSSNQIEEEKAKVLEVQIGNKVFSAVLYDNDTSQRIINMLPLTITMNELNGNEKYYYLDQTLPTNASRFSKVSNGDLMLYGSNCVVLFYESFATSYSYTPIGKIDNPSGLKNALGSSSALVTFKMR
jgi:hypothetical protein